ncbi:hypothetical protein M9434_006733 [Picochlorum sp. BPE23]|nr:hypothetical protein M9434_006733 [Picochlorum sp. BPE23]
MSTAAAAASYSTFTELGRFSKDDIEKFIHITGDTNPIHVDHTAATDAGFPGTIVPGILTASLFPSVISKHFPGAIYMSQTLKFRNYGLVGETFEAVVDIESRRRHHVIFKTQCRIAQSDHDTDRVGLVLVDGTAMARVP